MVSPDNEIKIYVELCESYRAIDDFRTKLLGILPIVTGTGISLLLDKLENAQQISVQAQGLFAAVGVFGTLVTLGLFSYELFGIKKCAALIQAGRDLEESMQIKNGQFIRRPPNIAHVINEPFAAGVIYPAVMAAWIYFSLAFTRPAANPWVPIVVLATGFAGTLLYESGLRRTYGPRTDRTETAKQQANA